MENAENRPGGTSLLGVMIPIFSIFFCMGFVDLVGIASNYVKNDLGLSDSMANMFPSMVFFWFLILGIPSGLLMNRIGRKNTVVVSMVLTVLAVIVPIFAHSFIAILLAFSLLGISNAVMQTSINPLVSNVISPQHLASTLTFGQFIHAICSALAPIFCVWGAMAVIPSFGLGWRILFPIYAVIGIISTILIARVKIKEEQPDKVSGFRECFSLLGDGFVFLCFCGIICHVGIDVGTNTTAPRILMERLALPLSEAGYATTVYFMFRLVSCLLGAGLLRKVPAKIFFIGGVLLAGAGVLILCFAHSKGMLYAGIGLIALGNSNLFSVIFAQCLNRRPSEGNELSGLMITGLIGGTIFPLAMGIAADMTGSQNGAMAVMFIGVIFLFIYSFWIRSGNVEHS